MSHYRARPGKRDLAMRKHPIADITARLEERLAARLVDRIRPLLAGRSAEIQRTVLADLAAELIAERQPGRCAARSRRQ